MTLFHLPPLTLRNAGRLFIALIIGLVVFTLVLAVLRELVPGRGSPLYYTAPSGSDLDGTSGFSYESSQKGGGMPAYDAEVPAPSMRNVVGTASGDPVYDTRAYYAAVRTVHFDETCERIRTWRDKEHVTIVQEVRGERSCFTHFKVPRAHGDTALGWVRELEPFELRSESESIKDAVTDYTAREQVLKERAELLEAALTRATQAYDELAARASAAGDVETLTKVTEGKLTQMERLSRERAAVADELERLTRERALALDRVDFVHFTVSVDRLRIVDGEELRMSWMYHLERFGGEVNTALQDLTLGLVADVLRVVIFVAYVLVLVAIAKLAWPFIRPHALRVRDVLRDDQPAPKARTQVRTATKRTDATQGEQ